MHETAGPITCLAVSSSKRRDARFANRFDSFKNASSKVSNQFKCFESPRNILSRGSITMLRPIVICGPSGSGKSTLLKRLLVENEDKLAFTISHTTRPPRQGETNGKEYHFVSRSTMERMIENNEFIESTEFSGNLYGTSKRAVHDALKTGKLLVLEVDIDGVKSINNNSDLEPIFIFIKPPSKKLLIQRLASRGTESGETLKKRLDRADEEIKFADSGEVNFDLILVNDDLDETYKKLKNFLSSSK